MFPKESQQKKQTNKQKKNQVANIAFVGRNY